MDLKRIADDVKNGVIETYYDNGQLELRETYEDGKLNGLHEMWYENGKLE
jgi:antitoxin component YwqK of YwqJK toxin-antitoxin module